MKSTDVYRAAMFACFAALIQHAAAALTWNGSASGAGATDGAGTWNSSNTNWWNDSFNTNWTSANADTAVFGAASGAAGTVAVSGEQTVGGIIFNSPGSGSYTLSGGTITLSGSPTIAANAAATISSVLAGTGFTKSGSGTLTLSGANSYSGGATVADGTLQITTTISALQNATAINGGATLWLNVGAATWANNFTGGGNITVECGSGHTWLTGDHHLFAGIIDITGGGSGKLVYGTTSATQSMLPDNGATIKVEAGTTLFAEQNAGTSALNFGCSLQLYGAGNSESLGAFRFDKPGGIWSGSVTLLGNSTIGNNSSGTGPTISGAISESGGSFGLTKQGVGIMTLAGTNSYSGVTSVSAGQLIFGGTYAVQNSTVANSLSGGIGFASVTNFVLGGLTGTQGLVLTNLSGQPVTLCVGNNNSNTTFSGVLSGPGSLVKIGSGVLTLSAANTYTGATVVAAGTLRLPVVSNLPPNLQIMPLGDSITYGYDNNASETSTLNGGYRGPLYNSLTSVASNFLFVGSSTDNYNVTTLPTKQRHHEGHMSYAIMNVWTNLDGYDNSLYALYGNSDRNCNGGHWLDGITNASYVHAVLHPDIILMMLGTNERDNTNGAQGRLDRLVSKLVTMRPNAQLMVARITPITDTATHSSFVTNYNRWLDSVVAKYAVSNRVCEVDLNTGFPSGGLSSDNLHPSVTGYNWMATQWYNALLAIVGVPVAGATVAAIPTNSPVTVAAGGTLDLGANRVVLSSLTLSNGATLAFSGVLAGTNAPITVSNLLLVGTVTVNISASSLANGSLYPLIRCKQFSGSGNLALGGVPAGVSAVLVTNSGVVYFIPTSVTPPCLTNSVSTNQLILSWPQDHTGWRLEAQTNSSNVGLGTNWFSVDTSNLTNLMTLPLDANNSGVFYRLGFP